MGDCPEYERINQKIDALQKKMDQNSAMYSQYYDLGRSTETLDALHERYCDEMDQLIMQRHKVAERFQVFA